MEPNCETQTLKKDQEILVFLPVLRVVSWCGQSHRKRRTALYLAGIILATFANSAGFAQPEVIRCVPPEVPFTDLSDAVLAEYRTEIAAEFEAYFAAVSSHIACLDSERSRALSEAHSATEAYSTFLNTPSAKKDLP